MLIGKRLAQLLSGFKTHKEFGDIRIPNTCRVLSADSVVSNQLALQNSFAGYLLMKEARCSWIHRCRWRPPSDSSDSARLEFSKDGRSLYEYCDDGMVEVWDKRYSNLETLLSLSLLDEVSQDQVTSSFSPDRARVGYLLVMGDYFMRILGRPPASEIPSSATGSSLADYLEDKSLDEAEAILSSYEASYGEILEDGFRVDHSTNPHIEGEHLYPVLAMRKFGNLLLERVGKNRVRRWMIREMKGSFPALIVD